MITRVRATAIVVHNDKLLTLLTLDPHDGRELLLLPGGVIEPHETAPEAAERETLEETGYCIQCDPSSSVDCEYDFYWNGETYHCLTLFYRGSLTRAFAKPFSKSDSSHIKEVVWLPLKEISTRLNYQSEILEATRSLFASNEDTP